MRPTAEQLEAFYATPLGRRVAARILQRLSHRLTRRASDRLLAIGYASPYLHPVAGHLERVIQAMPQRQGVIAWPPGQPNAACLVDDQRLPFVDALFDQVMLVHALEFTDPARSLLREVWRVLAPGGRILVLAPNRAGLWTHFERTPFGNGRPFGRGQISTLLEDALFDIVHWETVLVMPPHAPLLLFEKPARWLCPSLGGVHLLEARKLDSPAPIRGRLAPARRLATA